MFVRPVDYSDYAEFDRDHSAHQYIHSVGTSVHQVQLGHHSQCPPA